MNHLLARYAVLEPANVPESSPKNNLNLRIKTVSLLGLEQTQRYWYISGLFSVLVNSLQKPLHLRQP